MADTLTVESIEAELEKVREKRSRILDQKVISESVQGRQTVYDGAATLDALTRLEKHLLAQLRRLERGTGGIVVRTGVPVH